MKNKIVIFLLCLNVYSLELEVGGRQVNFNQNEALTSSQSEIFKINEEITYLANKNKSLTKILNDNDANYKSNPEQKALLLSIIQKNTNKIKDLKYEVSHQNFKKKKNDKALVSGFASFLDTCSSDLSNCKKEKKTACSASFNNKVLFDIMVQSKAECLNERLKFMKSSKARVISTGDFLEDLSRKKVIKYKFDKQIYKIAEINNCIAITTTSGHDRIKYNTHRDSTEGCLSQCKTLYLKTLLNHKNSALACFITEHSASEIRSLGIISKKESQINRLWNNKDLNSHLSKETINFYPKLNKAGEFVGF